MAEVAPEATAPETTAQTATPAVVAGEAPAPEKVEPQPATHSSKSVVTDQLPSDDVLNAVYELDVFDKEKKAVKFRTLVQQTANRRNLVVFIRHFFCGFCQEYIRALARDIPPTKLAELSIPTTLTIVGCGDPKLIPNYIKETGCPYEIYAEPTRKIYDKFGFITTLGTNPKKPEYIGISFWSAVFTGVKQSLKAGLDARKAGKTSQNGGELIWVDGELRFMHRMRNTTSHLEVKDLETVLV